MRAPSTPSATMRSQRPRWRTVPRPRVPRRARSTVIRISQACGPPCARCQDTPTELLPWAQAEMKKPGRMSPNAFCLPQGPKLGAANPFKIVQAPKTLVILNEDIFVYHQIHLDGREPPKDADPTWMGYSIGHWEGDALVVESTNFNDKSWLPFGRPHTEQLKVTERFRRPDEGNLEYEITYDDPGTFTKPWTMKAVTNLLVGDEIGEYVCTENEQDIGHYKVN